MALSNLIHSVQATVAFKLSGYALDRRHFRQEFYLIAGGIKVKHSWENLTAWDEIAL